MGAIRGILPFSSDSAGRHLMFCFHHAGGSASVYRSWVTTSTRINVVPIELPGKATRVAEPWIDSFSLLAEKLSKEVLFSSQGSSFVLYGHSMGAALAYQVAACLQEVHSRPPVALVVAARQAPGDVIKGEYHSSQGLIALRDELAAVGGTPAELLADDDVMGLLLPGVRRDYMLHESFCHSSTVLTCPIIALGGADDPTIDPEMLREWSRFTNSYFIFHIMVGGHFFPMENGPTFLDRLADDLDQLTSTGQGRWNENVLYWSSVLLRSIGWNIFGWCMFMTGVVVKAYGRECGRWCSDSSRVEVRWWVAGFDSESLSLSVWFSSSEVERIMRLKRVRDRRTRFLAHSLLKTMLIDHIGQNDEGHMSRQNIIVSHEPSGRPVSSSGIGVSVSHSVRTVAAAVANSGIVGVDVEDLSRAVEVFSVRDFLCSATELAVFNDSEMCDVDLLRLWVAKEALVKVGETSLDQLHQIDMPLLLSGPSFTSDYLWGSVSWWSMTYREYVIRVWKDDYCVGGLAYSV